MIREWPAPETILDVPVLLGFGKIYSWFIGKYAKETTPISDLQKKVEHSRMSKQIKWEWTRDAKPVFWNLKGAFFNLPILTQFELAELIILKWVRSAL